MINFFIWSPPLQYTKNCGQCGQNLQIGTLVSTLTNLNPYFDSSGVNCMICGIKYLLTECKYEIINIVRDDISRMSGLSGSIDSILRKLIREELHQIMKNECYDPNGPVS